MSEMMTLYKCTKTYGENHVCEAAYEADGRFLGHFIHSRRIWKDEPGNEKTLLITRTRKQISENDRIERREGVYRVLEVRRFPLHQEAILRKEEEAA
jgi:hypothetical protein